MTDDRDIKIYVKKSVAEAGEFQSINDEIQLHIANGNQSKAISLGQEMAKIKPEDGIFELGGIAMTSALLYQLRVLLTFTAEHTLRNKITVETLAKSACAAMYEYLKVNENGYYCNISDGAAFSFYRLALKNGGDEAANIGEQFSMLCNMSSREIAELGKSVYIQASDYFGRKIQETTFKEV